MIYKNIALYGLFVQAFSGSNTPVEGTHCFFGDTANYCIDWWLVDRSIDSGSYSIRFLSFRRFFMIIFGIRFSNFFFFFFRFILYLVLLNWTKARNLKKNKKDNNKNDCIPDIKAKFAVPVLNKKPNKMKTCKKLLKKKKTREALCQITEVQENCQSTCATCEMVIDPSVCEDTTLKFFVHDVGINKPKKKDCDWYVGKGYCDSSDTVKSMCPVSCDTCRSQAPSLVPSLSPSGSPSLVPSLSPSLVPSLSTSVLCFQTTDELKAEAKTFCSDPAAYNITKYG